MIRDITIGQYYKADSVIHRLDPRVKLMGTLIFIISLFMGMNIWIYAVVTVALAVVIKCPEFLANLWLEDLNQ